MSWHEQFVAHHQVVAAGHCDHRRLPCRFCSSVEGAMRHRPDLPYVGSMPPSSTLGALYSIAATKCTSGDAQVKRKPYRNPQMRYLRTTTGAAGASRHRTCSEPQSLRRRWSLMRSTWLAQRLRSKLLALWRHWACRTFLPVRICFKLPFSFLEKMPRGRVCLDSSIRQTKSDFRQRGDSRCSTTLGLLVQIAWARQLVGQTVQNPTRAPPRSAARTFPALLHFLCRGLRGFFNVRPQLIVCVLLRRAF